MMIMVQVPLGTMPCQVDDFPESAKRSKKGALHFRANSTVRLTEDEYNHVLNSPKHQGFGKRLLVVHKGESKLEKVARKAPERTEAPAPKAEVAKAEPALDVPKEDPKGSKKTKPSS